MADQKHGKLSDEKKISFKHTLNLPHTEFPIRPNSKENDPKILARWADEKLDKKTFEENKGKEKFILHDGPPYANGPIHLGHAYNKILKDIIAKSQRMEGRHVPVRPGWDCHGLPIELAVTKKHPGLSRQELIKECRAFANHWIDIQRDGFEQLGVLFDWQHPYLTMDHGYEASVLQALGIFVQDGYIEKKKKTVPWCPSCKTVLAAAEIEYEERKDPSIYVNFPLTQEAIKQAFPDLADKEVSLLVWTTTPWTLPLNRAVILRPKTTYQVLKHNDHYFIVAKELADTVCQKAEIEKEVVKEFNSNELSGQRVHHPFIADVTVPIIFDGFVSLEDGTACVHCAPGCGPQDYDIAVREGIDIYSPITPDGKYAEGIVPKELKGMPVADGQGWVIKKLLENDKLFLKKSIRHMYPHCWRCHQGLIFRATNQWFLNLEKHDLKKRALAAIEGIQFLPERSKNSLKATVENRLEWCISRQRVWGVPIPALLCKTCDYAFISKELIDKVAQGVAKEGIEYWDRITIQDLHIKDVSCTQCNASDFDKEQDIVDVWFESGVSHYAVLYDNPELGFPADLYLEGSDQHRAWFQSALLTSLVIEKEAAMKAILTHGFTVDEKGKKMSKSRGNVVSPTQLIDKMGTDGLRLWVSSIDYEGDAIVSDTLIKNVQEVYRKIRNTCRFLLSNLYDFDREKDAVALDDLPMIDKYALEQLFYLNDHIKNLYDQADMTGIFHEFADYCTNQLSSFYLDIVKDRLYVDLAHGHKRRSTQTVCWYILDTLTKLMAPILSFTAEQLADNYQKEQKSIHLQQFNALKDVWHMLQYYYKAKDAAWPFFEHSFYPTGVVFTRTKIEQLGFAEKRKQQWELLMQIRSAILKALEKKREEGLIKHPLEAKIILILRLNKQDRDMLRDFFNDVTTSGQKEGEFWKEFFIVSDVDIYDEDGDIDEDEELEDEEYEEELVEPTEVEGLSVKVERAQGDKCPRCWQYEVTDHEHKLCKRCQNVLAELKQEA